MSTETLVGNLEHKFGSVVEKTTDNRQKEGKNNIKHSGGLKKGSDDLLFQVLGRTARMVVCGSFGICCCLFCLCATDNHPHFYSHVRIYT